MPRVIAVLAGALMAACVLLGLAGPAVAGTGAEQATEVAVTAPAPDQQSQLAGVVSLVALGGLVLFGIRRIAVARHRKS